ncbi:tyrosine-type recombinase/integrase [Bacillus taeanensis]|uniref:tyrosine-type recombinase/integrase n=1 Tax=Bacillus taeanensis TaxID=273032 RepID=UPI001FEB03AB|nr:phage integrase N-terminal SAM-like domain-containing protein [Bacillus taeanensis]
MSNLFQQELPDYVEQFLYSLEAKGRQPSTIKRYRYDLADFLQWMRITKKERSFKCFQSLTDEEVAQYFHVLTIDRQYSYRTLKRVLTVLNQLYLYYRQLGKLRYNPLSSLSVDVEKFGPLKEEDFISEKEQARLLFILSSAEGLTEHQLKARHFLVDRNICIVLFFLHYGLTLKELVTIKMKDIHFERNEIEISSISSVSRIIKLTEEDKKQAYKYYQTIPKAVRPRYHSHDPFFVAFDFQRNTFRYNYEVEQPKALTEIAIQKMIREEVSRAGLRKGISAQHMRRTAVLNELLSGQSQEHIQEKFGFKTPLSLKRYAEFAAEIKEAAKQ